LGLIKKIENKVWGPLSY